MSLTELRTKLDDLVWSNKPCLYSDTIDLVNAQWTDLATYEQLFQWAHERCREYSGRHKQIQHKCDIRDAGVFVIYSHYTNISDRYYKVAAALDVRFGSRRVM